VGTPKLEIQFHKLLPVWEMSILEKVDLRQFKCRKKSKLVTSPQTIEISYPLPVSGFRFPAEHDLNRSTCSGDFLETPTSGTVSARKSSAREFARCWT